MPGKPHKIVRNTHQPVHVHIRNMENTNIKVNYITYASLSTDISMNQNDATSDDAYVMEFGG